MKRTFFKHFAFIDEGSGKHYPTSKRFGDSFRVQHFTGGSSGSGEADDEPSEEEKKGKTPEQIATLKERKGLLNVIQKKIDTALATRATKDELKTIQESQKEALKDVPVEALREMANEKTGVMAQLAEMALRMQKLEVKATEVVKDMSIRGQVAAWHEANKENILKIRAGEKVDVKPLEIRVASPMTVGTVNAGASPYIGRTEIESGINDFLVYPNKFWETIKKGRTNAPTYGWVNKTNRLGAAAFIAPGDPKPGVSFALEAETSNAKKIADSAKTVTELLDDIDGMVTFIETELKEQVFIKMNTVLMADDAATSTLPAGIGFYAVPYPAGVGIATTNPTYMDDIRAVVGYLRSGKLTGDITVFVNSIDAANMDLSKATDSGVYLLPPFTTQNGQVIAGAKIVEDQNMPVGTFLAAFLRYYRILIYKDFTVSWGWENDDFTRNLLTAVGEMRIHQFVNGIHTGFAVKDTFANVTAAITAV